MKKIIFAMAAFMIFISACSIIPREIVLDVTCAEISNQSEILGMLGPKPEESINAICFEECMNRSMRYTGAYECDRLTGNLKCACSTQMPG